jgi:hypothetical protein
MKLAEALIARSELQVRAKELLARSVAAARYQEGETPAEDASALIVEATGAYEELGTLVAQINQTNASYVLAADLTLTSALAQRDTLARRRALLTKVADAGAGKEDNEYLGRHFGARQMRSELRWEVAVSVPELRDECNQLAREHRELDALIQQANWTADLSE